jgi:hypothetical protein
MHLGVTYLSLSDKKKIKSLEVRGALIFLTRYFLHGEKILLALKSTKLKDVY